MRPALTALLLSAACTALAPPPAPARQARPDGARAIEFTDVTSRAGIRWRVTRLAPGIKYLIETMGGGGGFLDYNNDGLLDIYLVNYTQPEPGSNPRDALYRNNGDGTFADVSAKSGVAAHRAKGLGVVALDYNNDGRTDIFQANDSDPNFLFHNEGSLKFTEVALEAECALDPNGTVRGGMGVDAEDLDGDGFQDIFVTNFSQQTNAFWHNNGDGTFNETTYELGLGRVSLPTSGFGTRFLDYDNDGLTDLFVLNGHPFEPIQKVFPETTYAEPPFLFENTGKAFREVAAQRGAALKKSYLGRGLAVGDYDNDGDPDLLLMNAGEPPALLRNDGGNRNNWLGVELVGAKSNRDGTGALVTVKAGAGRRSKQLLGGASYFSASDLRLLFGLGGAAKVDELEVRWPSGALTRVKDVSPNRYLVVREDGGQPVKR